MNKRKNHIFVTFFFSPVSSRDQMVSFLVYFSFLCFFGSTSNLYADFPPTTPTDLAPLETPAAPAALSAPRCLMDIKEEYFKISNAPNYVISEVLPNNLLLGSEVEEYVTKKWPLLELSKEVNLDKIYKSSSYFIFFISSPNFENIEFIDLIELKKGTHDETPPMYSPVSNHTLLDSDSSFQKDPHCQLLEIFNIYVGRK